MKCSEIQNLTFSLFQFLSEEDLCDITRDDTDEERYLTLCRAMCDCLKILNDAKAMFRKIYQLQYCKEIEEITSKDLLKACGYNENSRKVLKGLSEDTNFLPEKVEKLLEPFKHQDPQQYRFWKNNIHILFKNLREEDTSEGCVEYRVLKKMYNCLSEEYKQNLPLYFPQFEELINKLQNDGSDNTPQETDIQEIFLFDDKDPNGDIRHVGILSEYLRKYSENNNKRETDTIGTICECLHKDPRTWGNYENAWKAYENSNGNLSDAGKCFSRDELLLIAIFLSIPFHDTVLMLNKSGYSLRWIPSNDNYDCADKLISEYLISLGNAEIETTAMKELKREALKKLILGNNADIGYCFSDLE